jgi:hypothetical protein
MPSNKFSSSSSSSCQEDEDYAEKAHKKRKKSSAKRALTFRGNQIKANPSKCNNSFVEHRNLDLNNLSLNKDYPKSDVFDQNIAQKENDLDKIDDGENDMNRTSSSDDLDRSIDYLARNFFFRIVSIAITTNLLRNTRKVECFNKFVRMFKSRQSSVNNYYN